MSDGERLHTTQCGLHLPLQRAGKGLRDLHTNEGACFFMQCPVYQIKTIKTKGNKKSQVDFFFHCTRKLVRGCEL